MQIIPYDDKYKGDVKHVCLVTGPDEAICDDRVGAYILNAYCNYYIENEKDNCFILEDGDKAKGYILCAPDYQRYRVKAKEYLKISKSNAGKDRVEIFAEQFALRLFSKRYPAHLHIDIEEPFTGKGAGTLLLKTLFAHLESRGVKGVMLIVGSGNKQAIRFYRRNGFKTVISSFGGTVMAKKLKTG